MHTSWGSATDRGRVRRLNEDSLLASPPVFLVADGMGGHAAGDVASRLVVEEFSRLAGRPTVSSDEVHECFRRAAVRLRQAMAAGSRAGTTVAGVAIVAHEGGSSWLVFNIGDSRVYRLRSGVLSQISVDHSVVQEMVDRGQIGREQARVHPDRHIVTRAVAAGSVPEPDYWLIPAGEADRLLVCSDGLTAELGDDVLAGLLRSVPDPQCAAQQLVAAALAAGGNDNISAVVVDVALTPAPADLESTAGAVDRYLPGVAAPGPGEPDLWDDDVDGVTLPNPARTPRSTEVIR